MLVRSVFGAVFALLAIAHASEEEQLESRAAAQCKPIVVIDTRGTGEAAGKPSMAFMNIMPDLDAAIPGKYVVYNTKYPAAKNYNYKPGTEDILKKLVSTLKQCPQTRFLLLGASQGAIATVVALQKFPPRSTLGRSIGAVLLFGNPLHRPNMESNVDSNGKESTDRFTGMAKQGQGIPRAWDRSGRVMDLCRQGDGVCTGRGGINYQHLLYPFDEPANHLAGNFLVTKAKQNLKTYKSRVQAAEARSASLKNHNDKKRGLRL